METKKISFGFSKVSKKTEIISRAPKEETQVQLIDCLEDQSIKIKDAVETKIEDLVIPIRGPSNQIVEKIKKAREKRDQDEITGDERPDSELSIDELAARELIREARNRDTVKTETKIYSLPVKTESFVAEGAEAPSQDDYENVPISDFGMAMLRGMDWKEGMPIGKRGQKAEVPKLPELRPKGLGLGANKMVVAPKPDPEQNDKQLQIVKGAFCKILAGNHRGHYCEVQGLDDENCRVIVKTSLTNEVLSLNEFLIVPVSKEEFAKNSRVLNNAKYEDYQKGEEVKIKEGVKIKEEVKIKKERKHKKKKDKYSDSEDERRRRKHKSKSRYDSDSEEESRRRRHRHRR